MMCFRHSFKTVKLKPSYLSEPESSRKCCAESKDIQLGTWLGHLRQMLNFFSHVYCFIGACLKFNLPFHCAVFHCCKIIWQFLITQCNSNKAVLKIVLPLEYHCLIDESYVSTFSQFWGDCKQCSYMRSNFKFMV